MKVDPTADIPTFFAGRSVLVTGATGFMGKVLIEKLLRSCPDVREIFLLMRPKKGNSIDDRFKRILSLPLYDSVREKNPQYLDKLIPVNGDVAAEGLGLQPLERKVLIERVSVIFHAAASVRFDDSLRDAVFMNLRSTRDVCLLATQMKNLVALVHVSTTYSHADKLVVEEKVYPPYVDWKRTIKIAETVDDHTLRILTPKYLGAMPNTYTFSKRLAEQVIQDFSSDIPAVIFRPSIVISSLFEPIKGWIDNFNGPVGMMVGGGKGILRTINIDPSVRADFIPVDIAIKAMIVCAWKRGLTTITADSSVQVYNCASSNIKSMSMKEIILMGLRLTDKIPLDNVLWAPHTIIVNNKTLFYLLTLLLHLLPAVAIDSVLKFSGRKPLLAKIQRKIYAANSALEYFLMNEWVFQNQKLLNLLFTIPPTDTKSFGYAYFSFDIYDYFRNCIIGAKRYLLKEDVGNLEAAKAHVKRMKLIHNLLKTWFAVFMAWLVYNYSTLPTFLTTIAYQ